jgi:hypothetical protein
VLPGGIADAFRVTREIPAKLSDGISKLDLLQNQEFPHL